MTPEWVTPQPVTPERRRRAKELFETALDAPAAERDALLDAACAGDAALRDEVLALLAAEAAMGSFLERPAAALLEGGAAVPAFAPGDVVAGYTVTGVLGEGGGGVVLDALQEQPRRAVALKLVRSAGVPGSALRAFRDETESLARLRHPAIAHVYAAGVHDADGVGVPWIAMERVEGARSITRYADEERLGRDARLALFREVCLAVHHAHLQGVIHRDVKPGNVLVDSAGRPKVVDFGIACRDVAGTAPLLPAGTRGYASPEQIRGDPGGVDARADVHGLGALLHELLTGAAPGADARPAARARLPADLRSILRRALEPDRDRRYASADALAADVARFLHGEPVAAHAGGPVYAALKFARRRRATAAALAAVAAALVVVTLVSVASARATSRALAEAERSEYAACVAAAAAALRADDSAEALRRLDAAPAAHRDWEWRHLRARADVSVASLTVAADPVWSGAASRAGSVLAAAHGDGRSVRVSVLDGAGRVLHVWEAAGARAAVAVAPDGSRVAAGLRDGSVHLRELATGVEREVPGLHDGQVVRLLFSPDGSLLASAGADGRTQLLDAATGALRRELARHGDRVIALAFSTDGKRLVTGCRDGFVRVFAGDGPDPVLAFRAHGASVEAVALSPDGATLASVSRDRTLRLSAASDGRSLAVVAAHRAVVADVAFAPSGDLLATASWDGTVRLWDPRTAADLGVLRGHGGAVAAVAFTAERGRLVSFGWDGRVRTWRSDIVDAPTLRGLPDRAVALAFDAAGGHLAACCADGTLLVAELPACREVFRGRAPSAGSLEFVDAPSAADDPRDVVRVAWADPGAEASARMQAWLRVQGGPSLPAALGGPRYGFRQGVADGRRSEAFRRDGAHGGDPAVLAAEGLARCVAEDPASGLVALGMDDGRVVLWSADARAAPREVRVAAAQVERLRFEPGGRRLAAACADGTARILACPELAETLVLSGHAGPVLDCVFVPGAARIVTASRDGTARVWDARDGHHLLTMQSDGYPVECLAVSADGRHVAAGAGAVEDPRSHVLVWSAPAR